MLAGAGALISGTLEHLRRPLARNIKEGQQVLVLSDTEHDPRVWQAIMTILADLKADATLMLFSRQAGRLLRSAEGRMRGHAEVGRQCSCVLHRHVALRRKPSLDGGRHSLHLSRRRHAARMATVWRDHRRHAPDRGAQALCRQERVRRRSQGMPGNLALRHRLHLSRRRQDLDPAAAFARVRSLSRSSTSRRTRTDRRASSIIISTRRANLTSRRSREPPTASSSSTSRCIIWGCSAARSN